MTTYRLTYIGERRNQGTKLVQAADEAAARAQAPKGARYVVRVTVVQ